MTKELIFKYNCLSYDADPIDSKFFEIDFEQIDKFYFFTEEGIYLASLDFIQSKNYIKKFLETNVADDLFPEEISNKYDCGHFWMLKTYDYNSYIVVRKQNEIKL